MFTQDEFNFPEEEHTSLLDERGELRNHTENFITGIVESLYNKVDVKKLEYCIKELCALYSIDVPNKKIKVRTK